MNFLLLEIIIGLSVGVMMTLQGIINTALANRVGVYGSVFIGVVINLILITLIILYTPGSLALRNLPGWNKWYLYLGGVLGIFILTAIVIILPRLGATQGFIYIIGGQLFASIIFDHYGLLGMEKAPVNITKLIGIIFFVMGAYLVTISKIKV
ncbi:MAG: DMT family transporter [Firmicutes bacterium]|jgi:transporter family-2 protein|nr:DMT family transporter [Bacillota bacterium]